MLANDLYDGLLMRKEIRFCYWPIYNLQNRHNNKQMNTPRKYLIIDANLFLLCRTLPNRHSSCLLLVNAQRTDENVSNSVVPRWKKYHAWQMTSLEEKNNRLKWKSSFPVRTSIESRSIQRWTWARSDIEDICYVNTAVDRYDKQQQRVFSLSHPRLFDRARSPSPSLCTARHWWVLNEEWDVFISSRSKDKNQSSWWNRTEPFFLGMHIRVIMYS